MQIYLLFYSSRPSTVPRYRHNRVDVMPIARPLAVLPLYVSHTDGLVRDRREALWDRIHGGESSVEALGPSLGEVHQWAHGVCLHIDANEDLWRRCPSTLSAWNKDWTVGSTHDPSRVKRNAATCCIALQISV